MDWFKGKIGNFPIFHGRKHRFPVEVPLNQSIETVESGLIPSNPPRSIAHARAAELAEQKEILRQDGESWGKMKKIMGKSWEYHGNIH